MTRATVLGVDIGTSSSKAVLVGLDGVIVRSVTRAHSVSRPSPGHVEMDAAIWWDEFAGMARELAGEDTDIVAIGVSGMGPCVLLADEHGEPVRPAILYGVDTRATVEIDELTVLLGADRILETCGSSLTSQAVGPKLAWLHKHENETFSRARRLFMPSSWLAFRLTGEYVLDFHSASQSTPLFDARSLDWHPEWAGLLARHISLPSLRWPGDAAGTLTADAARETGLPEGIPVLTGTIDAWSEAISAGAHEVGDLMLMYGTTMFLIHTMLEPHTSPSMWGTVGALPRTRNLAGGMATSGAITGWLRELVGSPEFPELLAEAAVSGPGARGLVMLPYFAGERTPIQDPQARGIIAGLSLSHTRGDLYRAALEATAMGVRHNIETMRHTGAVIERVVAVGGGTQGNLWTQIVSDVTGCRQMIPSKTIGASFGAAFLAAQLVADASIEDWNPVAEIVEPNIELSADYDELYRIYRELYVDTKDLVHMLAEREERFAAHD